MQVNTLRLKRTVPFLSRLKLTNARKHQTYRRLRFLSRGDKSKKLLFWPAKCLILFYFAVVLLSLLSRSRPGMEIPALAIKI